jgi:hypothetical protein
MAVAPSNARIIAGVAASVSLGVAQLVGIPFGARADARTAIGSVVVDLTPGAIKEWAIQTLGPLDKLFLAVVVLIVIVAIAAIAGSLETPRRSGTTGQRSGRYVSLKREHRALDRVVCRPQAGLFVFHCSGDGDLARHLLARRRSACGDGEHSGGILDSER